MPPSEQLVHQVMQTQLPHSACYPVQHSMLPSAAARALELPRQGLYQLKQEIQYQGQVKFRLKIQVEVQIVFQS